MYIGLLMLIGPIVVYLATLPFFRWFIPRLRTWFYGIGGTVAFAGGVASLCFAMYSGDQGGIAAYFFQLAVIFFYVTFSLVVAISNWWILSKRSKRDKKG